MWNTWNCFIHFQKTKLTSSQLWFNFMWVTREFHGKIPTENQFSHDAHPLYYFVIKQSNVHTLQRVQNCWISYSSLFLKSYENICSWRTPAALLCDPTSRFSNVYTLQSVHNCWISQSNFSTMTYENIVFTFVSVFFSLMFWSLTCSNRTWRQRCPFEIC